MQNYDMTDFSDKCETYDADDREVFFALKFK